MNKNECELNIIENLLEMNFIAVKFFKKIFFFIIFVQFHFDLANYVEENEPN